MLRVCSAYRTASGSLFRKDRKKAQRIELPCGILPYSIFRSNSDSWGIIRNFFYHDPLCALHIEQRTFKVCYFLGKVPFRFGCGFLWFHIKLNLTKIDSMCVCSLYSKTLLLPLLVEISPPKCTLRTTQQTCLVGTSRQV